ncbi:lysophospholipid acyltransferase family protein [Maribacter sp. 2307ULW6-5]|uniref:lysophospholipid acyltransferase family protein n=1 Tax=Maribacter sp. 2307ULW6-5 TaxID=3386275 RepID=UPI0039BC7853
MWYGLLKIIFKFALHGYHRHIGVYGLENVPTDKPVLFLPNHQSALLDVLLVVVDCNRKPYFLTRADVFGKPLLNAFFKFLRMIPIYRIRDGRDKLAKNDAIFDICAEVLGRGEAIAMFPEANHNLRRRVRPLSKGFTRVLFRTLERYPDLDLQIVPVGLNYKHAETFPDEVAIYYGKPISVAKYYDAHDVPGSVGATKEAVAAALRRLTTHVGPEGHYGEIVRYLERKGVDFLDPKAANALVEQWTTAAVAPVREKAPKPLRMLLLFLILLNLPVILLWKLLVKPKVWEPEFTGTLRFATAFVGFLVYGLLLFVLLSLFFGGWWAGASILLLLAFNWCYVKYGSF